MPRYRLPPLTVADLWDEAQQQPVRVRDLIAITGLHRDTVLADIYHGALKATLRSDIAGSPYIIQRADAREWLVMMGFRGGPISRSA